MRPVQRVNVPTPSVEVIPAGFPSAGANWWDPLGAGLCIWAAYQPKGAANFAASLLDLSGNGNNAGDPGGLFTPGWNAVNGWVFDGINDYLTTTFVPQNDQSQTMIVQYTNLISNFAYLCGMRTAANREFVISGQFGAAVVYRNGNQTTPAPQLLTGNLAVAGNQGYRNGVADGGAIGAWAAAALDAVYIGCRNVAGLPSNFTDYDCTALALYDCTLTAPQVLAVATAMAAL